MDYAALAQTILAHPLTWAGVTLAAAPVAAWVLNLQLRALGLVRKPHHQGIAWNLVLSFLAFWLVLCMGLGAVAEHAEISGLQWPLSSLASSLLGLIPPILVLAGAAHYARMRQDEARDASAEIKEQVQAEQRWLRPAAGALAGLALLGGRVLWPLLVFAVGGTFLWLLASPSARERARVWRREWAAGQRLRTRLQPKATIQSPDATVTLAGSVGLLTTDVLDGGQLRSMSNEVLAELVEDGAALG